MMHRFYRHPALGSAVLLAVLAVGIAACANLGGNDVRACGESDGRLRVGYYAYFEPVSFTKPDESPWRMYGFEADLLDALESIDGANLRFDRVPIEHWDGIWLAPTKYVDIAAGGITILESRTKDESGSPRVAFTSGHIALRHSLLTRAEDADGFSSYADLGEDVRVGVMPGTTGESRLLQLIGLADEDGTLSQGVQVETDSGMVLTDGSSRYFITAGAQSPEFAGRTKLVPPPGGYPPVTYLGMERGESELLEALESGEIDAIARGGLWKYGDASQPAEGEFVVAVADPRYDWAGFTLELGRDDLLSCLNEHIDYLTDDRSIGYAEWLEDSQVFMNRATSR